MFPWALLYMIFAETATGIILSNPDNRKFLPHFSDVKEFIIDYWTDDMNDILF